MTEFDLESVDESEDREAESDSRRRFIERIATSDAHRVVSVLEPWAVLIALGGLLLSIFALLVERVDRRENLLTAKNDRRQANIVSAWQLILTTSTPGNSGKVAALEYLNSQGMTLTGVDLSSKPPGVWLVGAKIAGIDLSSADLTNANLSEADLSGSDLLNIKLTQANLMKANLANADLSWADLTIAELWKANLSGADLSNADLTAVNFSNTDLSNTNLSEATLDRACSHGGTKYPEGSELPAAQ